MHLDNRGLMLPEPMMRVLDALERLTAGEVLEVFNDHRPMFLYPILAERGWTCETEEHPEGYVRLLIRKAADA